MAANTDLDIRRRVYNAAMTCGKTFTVNELLEHHDLLDLSKDSIRDGIKGLIRHIKYLRNTTPERASAVYEIVAAVGPPPERKRYTRAPTAVRKVEERGVAWETPPCELARIYGLVARPHAGGQS